MKTHLNVLFSSLLIPLSAVTLAQSPNSAISLNPIRLSTVQQQTLLNLIKGFDNPNSARHYDDQARMTTYPIDGYQYHRDATSGTFHEIRGSMAYALTLLSTGDKALKTKAFGILERGIALQDTVADSPTKGIWGYYLEEPLKTKKSPPDFNMADFNAVTLLDVWMSYGELLPTTLRQQVRHSLVLAAESIRKRNMGPHYTNIAVMGSYVTYLVGHLFNLPDLQQYGQKRIETFYAYTLQKGGFTEYNSPTYTLTALEDLNRMQQHIVEPGAKQMVDSLYNLAWSMLARHYHQPTGQWTGPHSRAYRSLVSPGFYNLLHEASDGQLFTLNRKAMDWSTYGRVRHQIPAYLMGYFTQPTYPRTERDVFEIDDPQVIGTSYLTNHFALSTCNRSSLWNQRRPFLAYWGSVKQPQYVQVRFLHDDYDFSSAGFYSQQKEGQVLAGINLNTNGGDKHISIDLLKDGTVEARDFRLRFEFGNTSPDSLRLPTGLNEPLQVKLNGLFINLNLFKAAFNGTAGHWEKGSSGTTAWLDYVVYNGPTTRFDLNTLPEAIWAFTISIGPDSVPAKSLKPKFSQKEQTLKAAWQGLTLDVPTNVLPQPKHVSWN